MFITQDAVILARALEFNSTLATLNFTHNPIGEVRNAQERVIGLWLVYLGGGQITRQLKLKEMAVAYHLPIRLLLQIRSYNVQTTPNVSTS